MPTDDMRALRETGIRLVGAVASLVGLFVVVWGIVVSAPLAALAAAVLVAPAAVFALSGRADLPARLVMAVTCPLLAALLLAMASGTGWILDMHMTFFALLAVLCALCDWRAIVVGTVVIALHHLAFNFLAPALVFSDGSDLLRVLFHAVVVLAEAVVLIVLCRQFEALVRNLAEVRRAEAALAAERDAERERLNGEQQTVLSGLSERLRQLAAGDLSSRLDTPFPANMTAPARCSTSPAPNSTSWSARSPVPPVRSQPARTNCARLPPIWRARPNIRPPQSRAPRATRATCSTRSRRSRACGPRPAPPRSTPRTMPTAAPPKSPPPPRRSPGSKRRPPKSAR